MQLPKARICNIFGRRALVAQSNAKWVEAKTPCEHRKPASAWGEQCSGAESGRPDLTFGASGFHIADETLISGIVGLAPEVAARCQVKGIDR